MSNTYPKEKNARRSFKEAFADAIQVIKLRIGFLMLS